MYVNVYYDDSTDCDVIELSAEAFQNIGKIQNEFFEWMFNPANAHRFWKYKGFEKIGCAYDSEAFIDWLHSSGIDLSARIISRHTILNINHPTISF